MSIEVAERGTTPAEDALLREPEAGTPEERPPSDAPGGGDAREATGRPAVNPVTTTLAAVASSLAAAWIVSSVFLDFSAHFVAVGGVVIGGGLVLLSYRRGVAWLQVAVIPASILVALALVAPDSQPGSPGFIGQVEDALHSGGLLQPPVDFDPGWRAILVVLFAALPAGSAALGVALRRPRLAFALPVPLIMGAALVQPVANELPSVVVALVLLVLAMTLAYGAELSGTGQLSVAFEGRRVARGAAVALGLAVAMVSLNSLDFLFPASVQTHVIPPTKPQIPPAQPDRVLFTYTADRAIPLRLGVIDIYDTTQQAWLLPSYDVSRLRRLQPPASVPADAGVTDTPSAKDIAVSITIRGEDGHLLPDVAGLEKVGGMNQAVNFDPETDGISLADKPVFNGLSYTVTGAPVPSGHELAMSGKAPASLAPYLVAPPVPTEVTALIDQYSQRAARAGVAPDGFDEVQFLRQSLYDSVTAAGSGVPVDVSAARVSQMLNGGDASPYEIVAAEALMARWAGVPARIGYGYYGGVAQKDRSFAVHPVNGAMWLEVYFNHYGWQPLFGVPPKAKPSTSTQQKNQVNIPSTQLGQLIVYIPVQYPTIELLFEYVRWYLARILPVLALLVLAVICYPWLCKVVRRRRRRRWGRRHGLDGRIAVAYSEFRDRCRDLTVGDPSATPVGFLRYVVEDDEHAELAWQVTRSLWGDLRRDLRKEDADAAERMAASVARRIDRAHPFLSRLFARIARTSLRQPYSDEVPNFWFEPRVRLDLRGRLAGWRVDRRRRALARRRARRAVPAAVATVLTLLISSCGGAPGTQNTRALPASPVPKQLGPLSFQYEASPSHEYRTAGSQALVTDGNVYSMRSDGVTVGAFEVSVFKPGVDISDIDDESKDRFCTDNPLDCPGHEIFEGIQSQMGSGRFQRVYYRDYERAYVMDIPLARQRIYLWFPPGTETVDILIVIGQFGTTASDALFHALMDYQHHHATGTVQAPVIPAATPLPSSAGTASPSPASPSPSSGG